MLRFLTQGQIMLSNCFPLRMSPSQLPYSISLFSPVGILSSHIWNSFFYSHVNVSLQKWLLHKSYYSYITSPRFQEKVGGFFSYWGKIALQQFVKTDPTSLLTVPKQQYRDSSAIHCHGLELLV